MQLILALRAEAPRSSRTAPSVGQRERRIELDEGLEDEAPLGEARVRDRQARLVERLRRRRAAGRDRPSAGRPALPVERSRPSSRSTASRRSSSSGAGSSVSTAAARVQEPRLVDARRPDRSRAAPRRRRRSGRGIVVEQLDRLARAGAAVAEVAAESDVRAGHATTVKVFGRVVEIQSDTRTAMRSAAVCPHVLPAVQLPTLSRPPAARSCRSPSSPSSRRPAPPRRRSGARRPPLPRRRHRPRTPVGRADSGPSTRSSAPSRSSEPERARLLFGESTRPSRAAPRSDLPRPRGAVGAAPARRSGASRSGCSRGRTARTTRSSATALAGRSRPATRGCASAGSRRRADAPTPPRREPQRASPTGWTRRGRLRARSGRPRSRSSATARRGRTARLAEPRRRTAKLDIYIADVGAIGLYGYCTSDDPRRSSRALRLRLLRRRRRLLARAVRQARPRASPRCR